jgi:hypothetical protein
MFPANITTSGEKGEQGNCNYLWAATGRSSPYWEVDLSFRKQTTSTINVPSCVCVKFYCSQHGYYTKMNVLIAIINLSYIRLQSHRSVL